MNKLFQPKNFTSLKFFFFFFSMAFIQHSVAQENPYTILSEMNKISIRGLSVVDNQTFWACGNQGMFARSINGGKQISWQVVPGYENRDFRDIEAFDANTAIIMGVDAPAIILKTTDAGKTWKKVFEDSTTGMFLDAMKFINQQEGMVIGDPIQGKMFRAITMNGGENWQASFSTSLNEGEAFFASSGTNLVFLKNQLNNPIMVTGGITSSLLFNNGNELLKLPMIQGSQSTGANSIDLFNNKAIIVGGDFSNDRNLTENAILVNFTGKKPQFSKPNTPPNGYRSCVLFLDANRLIACGSSGIDISKDGGLNWELVSRTSFHVCQKAKKGTAVYLAGSNGKIAVWNPTIL